MLKALGIFWLLTIGFLAVIVEWGEPSSLSETLFLIFIAGPLFIFFPRLVWLIATKLTLPIFTFGYLRVEPKNEEMPFPLYGIARRDGKKFVVVAEVGLCIGILLIVLVGISISELWSFVNF